jgi:hypothetical protein
MLYSSSRTLRVCVNDSWCRGVMRLQNSMISSYFPLSLVLLLLNPEFDERVLPYIPTTEHEVWQHHRLGH